MKINASRKKKYIKKRLQKFLLTYLGFKDIQRFSKNASFSIFDEEYEKICSRILYNVHALEKGLSHSETMRFGFGKKALSDLNDCLNLYEKKL